MRIGRVVGNIWATRKDTSLAGFKLMVVEQEQEYSSEGSRRVIAVDYIGAGIGERVIIATGSAARNSKELSDSLVDATIVGILDEEK